MFVPRKGGPDKCPGGPCSECVGGPHHFNEAMLEDESTTEVDNHEAIAMGVGVWYECKHCEAWLEYDLDGELDDGEVSGAPVAPSDNGTIALNFGEAYGVARQIDLETNAPVDKISTCACPQTDAQDCARFRHGLDMKEIMGDTLTEDEAQEECSCSCHEADDRDGGWGDED